MSVFEHLRHIYDPKERWLVGLADLGLAALTWPARRRRPDAPHEPRRILLLRLERIGDLLMTIGAIEAVRATFPSAQVDLVVGGWNHAIAQRLPVDRVERLDAPWLSRDETRSGARALWSRAAEWRARGFDLAINLEGDIRSNVLLGLSRAPVRVGFAMAGGGAALTHIVEHDPTRHTDENTRRLVREAARAFGREAVEPAPRWPRFELPELATREADRVLGTAQQPRARRLIGLHVSGGREIKQWYPSRFGEATARMAHDLGAAIVLTGTTSDRALIDSARSVLPRDAEVIDLAGSADLLTLAAVLSRLDLFVTGDTGPMHLAAAMGTPVVAVFGLSDPRRYAPLAPHARVVRIDLPCAPCNRVRLPPERCRGHVPDCLEGVTSEMVYAAARDLLAEVGAAGEADRALRAMLPPDKAPPTAGAWP